MNLRLDTRYEEMCLEVKVAVTMPTKVRIKIFDEQKPKIVFTDRYKTVNSDYTFYVRMPITSKSIIISVYDDKKGNLPQSQDANIKVVSVDKTPLQKRIDVVDIHNPTIAYFVDFAQRFCYNAPYLEANKSYQSDNGGFMIEYLPTIIDAKGKELTTPARISRISGRIQVSKKQFDQYTVPMRFAILCHEFSHFYVNEDMTDESEADMNGLLIYLGLGYPRIEAFEAFLEVFEHYPSQENKKRYDKIKNFIDNFEKDNIVFR
jgi:hypothetical protein